MKFTTWIHKLDSVDMEIKVMCCLMMGIRSEKCVLRQFCHCLNIRVCLKAIWCIQLYILPVID
uniref:Uncharacterized protein n=1 Tax=Castor canadensis TaxID=51338 RepID=A0A8C0ZNE6_CASCN